MKARIQQSAVNDQSPVRQIATDSAKPHDGDAHNPPFLQFRSFNRPPCPKLAFSHGFTLIEIIALSVVMLILAATAVPWFSNPNTHARDAALDFNLNLIRAQIEAYKNQHGGFAPRLSLFAAQMIKPTSPKGQLTGKDLTCGPYFQRQIPVNPFNGSNSLINVAKPGHAPIGAVPSPAGWLYDETNGAIYPNNPEYYSRRR